MFGHAASWQTVCRFSVVDQALQLAVPRAPRRRDLEPRRFPGAERQHIRAKNVQDVLVPTGVCARPRRHTREFRRSVAWAWNTLSPTYHKFFASIARMPEPARESEPGGRFFEPALVAARQHGVFHVNQVALSPRAVQKRAAAGHYHRQHAGVYSIVPRHLLKREGLWMAAVLACGPGAVLSHRSAAALLELRDWGGTKIDVTVPRRSRRKHAGIKVHCSTTLTDQDVTEVNNIPCTTVARTLFDLAEVVTQRQLERSFDQAEISERLDLTAINDQLARNPTRPGAKAVRRVLTEPLHRQDAHRERERGGAPGDHARTRHPRPGHQRLRHARRRWPTDQARISSGATSASSSRRTARSGITRASDSNKTA